MTLHYYYLVYSVPDENYYSNAVKLTLGLDRVLIDTIALMKTNLAQYI